MALRERLVREAGTTAPLSEDVISNQQGFQDMKARLHRMLINRMDLTKLGMLEPEQVHEEVARGPTKPRLTPPDELVSHRLPVFSRATVHRRTASLAPRCRHTDVR